MIPETKAAGNDGKDFPRIRGDDPMAAGGALSMR